MSSVLAALGTRKYADLIAATHPALAVGIQDLTEDRFEWLVNPCKRSTNAPPKPAPNVRRVVIRTYSGEDAALAYYVTDPSLAGESDARAPLDMGSFVNAVTDCMTAEFQQRVELDQMATELGDRYDELNLVYESCQPNADASSESLLASIPRNCVAFMGVDAAVIDIPEFERVSISHSPAATDPFMNALRKEYSALLLPMLAQNREPLVVNNPDAGSNRVTGIPYKLIAAPIVDERDHQIGVLYVLNRPTSANFTNGDRSLVETMARNAARIIEASFDALTGFLNRNSFELELGRWLDQAQHDGINHSMLMLGLDQTRVHNDTHGSAVGDELIRRVAQTLKQNTRSNDILGRISGDTYGLLLRDQDLHGALGVAEKLREIVSDTNFDCWGAAINPTMSVGVYAFDAETDSTGNVLSAAEIAMRGAKEGGRNRVEAYHEQNLALKRRHQQMRWLVTIQTALREDRFVLFGQPIVATDDPTRAAHIEVLIRLPDDKQGFVPPGAFLPAAESFLLMTSIDQWVVRNVLFQIAPRNQDLLSQGIQISINLSGQSLSDARFETFLVDAIEQSPVAPEALCFEVTETMAIGNFSSARRLIDKLKAIGCSVHLDDFGTGVSTFEYLKELPVDAVKIDGVFIKDILSDPVTDTMVQAITSVARSMGRTTIAEFVENDEIRQRLAEIGVDFVQGYGIAKPGPLGEQLSRWVS